ncbi:hypothetical protein [Haloferax sp. ATB1]|uniref:hypothetical protein n=1 Tax=Haloferax sp. ATB1 TaxID=1508454 RepID=UPI000FE14523|nr:hypothetical protein [Haloferax sp. ATB1]
MWTDVAAIDSPRDYAINAALFSVVATAALRSSSRDAPSPTVTALLTSPPVAVWCTILTKWSRNRYGGILLKLGKIFLVFVFWASAILVYFAYIVVYVTSSDTSIFIITLTLILTGASFGAILGKFNGVVSSSVKNSRNKISLHKTWTQTKWIVGLKAIVLPASFIAGISVAVLGESLQNPSFGVQFAYYSSSIPITILLFLTTGMLLQIIGQELSEIYNVDLPEEYNNWSVQGLSLRMSIYTSSDKTKEYGDSLPVEVADALRGDDQE